jgi:hypothetical protein
MSGFFDVPLNLPHATTIALRIVHHLERLTKDEPILDLADKLVLVLAPWQVEDRNPRPEERGIIDEVARMGRELVAECERLSLKDDRLGQAVRNLFECLELGREGAVLSLRAGENPSSLLRPD